MKDYVFKDMETWLDRLLVWSVVGVIAMLMAICVAVVVFIIFMMLVFVGALLGI